LEGDLETVDALLDAVIKKRQSIVEILDVPGLVEGELETVGVRSDHSSASSSSNKHYTGCSGRA
jgi:hypothetical protein